MKRLVAICFVLLSLLRAGDGFLSNDEYAKKLYNNPRGISCAQCHGEKGEGGVLSAYVIDLNGKKKLRDIIAPQINNIKMFEFLKAFEQKMDYMPIYYLTDKELAYIFFYLSKQGKMQVEVTDTNTTNTTTTVSDVNVTDINKSTSKIKINNKNNDVIKDNNETRK